MTNQPLETRVTRRTAFRVGLGGAAALSLAALLDACGGSGGSASISSTPDKATGKVIKTLNVGLPGTLSNIYPGVEDGILNYYVASLVGEGLVAIAPSGEVIPALAASFKRPDAKTFIYKLRSGAKFGDGTPLTIDDVLYSLKMAADAKVSPNLAYYYSDAKVTQTGADEITIKLSDASVSFQYVPSAADALWVAPKAFWQKGSIGTAQALLEGTGPYKVTSFQPDSHVFLEQSGNWWGGKPKIDRINVQFITDDNARYLAQKSGNTQMSFNVPFESLSQWQSLSGNRVISIPDRSWVGLIFNVADGPTKDIHVRTAIAHCIDRSAVVTDLLKGQGQVATALSSPEQFPGVYSPAQATSQLAAIPQVDFSIAQAKQELAKSSSPHGFTATLTYPNTGPQLGTAALSLAQNLKKIGITLNVSEVTVSQWLATIGAKGTPISFMWYFNTTPDPGELPSYLLSSTPANPAKYVSSQVDALLTKAAGELDPHAHAQSIIQAQKIALADLPYFPLWWGHSATAFANTIGVKDFTSYTFESPWAGSLYTAS